MLRVQEDRADEAGQFRPCQGVLQLRVSVSVSDHKALGPQTGGSQLLGTWGLCCPNRAGQYDYGHGSGQEQGDQFSAFHAQFLQF